MTNGILLNGSADIDFMIHGVFPYQFFGQTVWITTTHICLLIVLLLILAFAIAANRAMKHASEVPGFFQNIVELVVEKLDGMVKMVMGKNAAKFANYIGTIFIFILISNFSGLLGLRPPTADYGVTLPLGLATFTLIHYNKLKHKKLKGALAELCDPWPIWAPINIIGYIAVPVSQCAFRRCYDGAGIRTSAGDRNRLACSAACVLRSVFGSNSDLRVLYADDDIPF